MSAQQAARRTPKHPRSCESPWGSADTRARSPTPAVRAGTLQRVSAAPIILGYDPETLRERIDPEAARARLDVVQQFRSLAAMNERVSLLRLLGRLDEAFDLAQAAYRQSMFTGSREDILAARMRRAVVTQFQGEEDPAKLELAISELTTCAEEALSRDWHVLAGTALQHRGKVHFDRGDYQAALADFEQAEVLRRRDGVPPDQLASTQFALQVVRELLGSGDRTPVTLSPSSELDA